MGTRGTCASEVLGIPAVPVLTTGPEVGLRRVPEPEAEIDEGGTDGETDGETNEGPAVGRCCWTAA